MMNAKVTALFLVLLPFHILSQVLNSPESVVFDSYSQQYIISNAGTGTSGGSLVYMHPETQELTSFIADGVQSPKGLTIINNMVYVTDVTAVRGFPLDGTEPIFYIDVPGSSFLNDLTSKDSVLYASDNAANRIFEIDLQAGTTSILCDNPELQAPNGIYYDEQENRLLICSYRANSPIQEYDFASGQLSTLTTTFLSQLDGITMDANRNVYVSSWGSNAVYKFDPDFNNDQVEVSNGHFGPADIFIRQDLNLLVVPNFMNNTLDFVDLGPMSIEEEMNPFQIQVFPNPGYSKIYLSFQTVKSSHIKIQAINQNGKIVAELCKREFNSGQHQLSFEMKKAGLEKGIYFLKFSFDDRTFIKRLVLL